MRSVLLLHGFTGAPESWAPVREELPSDLHVLAPWLVGHGEPPAAPEVTGFEEEVDRIARYLPRGDATVVAGYSLGARLALGLALRHGGRLRGVVLVSGSAGLETEAERHERRRADAAWCELLETEGLEAFVRRWEKLPLFDSQRQVPEALLQSQRGQRLAHRASGLAHSLRSTGLAEMPNYRGALGEVTLPVELLVGALDSRFCALAEAIVGSFPNGRLTRVRGAGHNLLLEQPAVVARAIARGFGV
jgi:2-succinyl-6-hydroxy-2,4-cyclohexadiene-1-carboxylate synthase